MPYSVEPARSSPPLLTGRLFSTLQHSRKRGIGGRITFFGRSNDRAPSITHAFAK